MLLRHLRQLMLLPREEYVINQRASIRGLDAQLLSFTVEKDRNCLWMIYRDEALEQSEEDLPWRESRTNRQQLLHSIEANKRGSGFHIHEIEIQGQMVKFGSSRSQRLSETNLEGQMQLQHFAEQGLLPARWDEVELESITIAQYEQERGAAAPDINEASDLAVILHIDRSAREIPIQRPFTVSVGKQDSGTKVTYHDPLLGEECYFFVDDIYPYDIYQEALQSTGQIADVCMQRRARQQLMQALGNLCPPDKHLAVIRYEAPDDVQLRFMQWDHLEREPVRSNTGIALGRISDPAAVGINGHKLQECVLQPMDKDFSGELELELFSRVVVVPAEVIRCSVE